MSNYETLPVSEVVRRLKFWRDHPHSGLPSYLEQAIAVLERQEAEIKELKKQNAEFRDSTKAPSGVQALEQAAKIAAKTGKQSDLKKYLQLRREHF